MSDDPGSSQALAELRGRRAEQEAIRAWFGPVRWLVVLLVAVAGFRADLASHHHDRVAVAILLAVFTVTALGTVATFTGPVRRHAPFLIMLFVTSVTLVWLQPGGLAEIGLFVAVAFGIRVLPVAAGAAVAAASAVMVAASEAVSGSSVAQGLLSGFAFVGVYLILIMSKRLREGAAQAEQMLAELEQSRGARARALALAERQRLAREMHDVLAHSLSGLMLQLEGARMLAKDNPADPRLPGTIERAHHLGQAGLAEARRAIGMLRDDDLPGPEQLGTLVEQFERDSGVRCQLAVTGAEHELDSEARLALYRVAQEALTNVRKHAHPDRVDVRLVYQAERTCLTVEDFGAATNGSAANGSAVHGSAAGPGGDGTGYGLTGMRERAELLGGSLTAGPTGQGFRVELEVPA